MKTTYSSPRISSLFAFTLFVLGFTFFFFAYENYFPIIVSVIYYFLGIIILLFFRHLDVFEWQFYTRLFLLGYLSTGIVVFFRVYANDMQVDSTWIFDTVNKGLVSVNLLYVQEAYENAIPMLSYYYALELASDLGLPKEIYVASFLNVIIFGLSGVVALKVGKVIYGNDFYRLRRLVLIYSSCGIFWLYSGFLLRDAFALLFINLLIYMWVIALTTPKLSKITAFKLFFFTIFGVYIFKYIRLEFQYLPIIFFICGLVSLFYIGNLKPKNKNTILVLYMIFFILLVAFILLFVELSQTEILTHNKLSYDDLSISESKNSLGEKYIINQPVYFRLIFGSVYLLIFPIPVWSGFQLQSSYHIFKSLNTIFLYFLLPLFFLSIKHLIINKNLRIPSFIFLLLIFLSMTLSISLTSIETRHHGVFYLTIFLVSLIPDLRVQSIWNDYLRLLAWFLIFVIIIHFSWVILKGL